jgi:ADP-ribose pyrophosphatase
MKKLSEKTITIKDATSGYDKKIISKKFLLPNGMVENFFIDEAKDSVQVFALTANQSKVVIVKQFRPGTESYELELPGGSIEPGEDPRVAAIRELKEETSYESSTYEVLSSVPYSPYSTGKRYNVLAADCRRSSEGLDLDPNEFLKAGTMSLEDFREAMLKGTVRGFETAYQGLERLGLL